MVNKFGLNSLLDSAGETLVLVRVVVLQVDLQFHGFNKFPLLFLASLQDGVNPLKYGLT